MRKHRVISLSHPCTIPGIDLIGKAKGRDEERMDTLIQAGVEAAVH